MSKRRRKRDQADPLYQRRLYEGDMVWLAKEYLRRLSSESSLTLEDFATQYAVSADELRSYIPELSTEDGHFVALWHGTTRSRAESILKEGFKPKRAEKSQVYFTRSLALAKSYANVRSKNEKDHPAVIMCSINLGHYNDYEVRELRGAAVFVFRAECIASDVVSRVSGLARRSKQRPKKSEKRKDVGLTSVALTFTSARPSIAYWINSYLDLDNADRVQEEHEVVEKIKRWLDDQTDAGRFGEVPDDEMLEQVQQCLPQYLP